MALAVLDGNQSATTLSSVVTGGEHIVAHSVVSLGSNAISNITTAVSGSVVTIPNLNVLARSVATEGITDGTLNFVKIGGHQDGSNQTAHIVHVSGGGAMKVDASDSTVTFGTIRGTVTIGNTVTIAGTVTANPTGTQTIAGTVTANLNQPNFVGANGDIVNYAVQIGYFDDGYGEFRGVNSADSPLPITLTNPASVNSLPAIPAGTNRIGVVTIGGGTVTIGAGTAQIGSVTASISGTVPISISSVTVGNSVTIGSLPLIGGAVTANNLPLVDDNFSSTTLGAVRSALYIKDTLGGSGFVGIGNDQDEGLPVRVNGTALPISGTVTANGGDFSAIVGESMPAKAVAIGFYNGDDAGIAQVNDSNRKLPISGTVTAVNHQGTAVTTSNFTSTTASTTLASANASREVLTIFNEGAGNLHICAGATCTTIAYQVRLSAGDYYEVPLNQTSLTHSAVFATAGTARVTQVS